MNLSRHLPRILTGVSLLCMLGAALWLSGPYFYAFLLLFTLLGLWEFYAMFWSGTLFLSGRLLGLALGGGLMTMAWFRPEMDILSLGMATILLVCFFLFRWAHNPEFRFSGVAVVGSGLLYIPVLLMPALNFSLTEQLFLICATAASDTAAYFVGVRFGKHRIWPKVSPKKSIEGSIGGLLACTLSCILIGLAFGKGGFNNFLVIAVILGIMAQLGDFFESALKRSRSVKDSGVVLPGHGGVLDRIDSLLFVIPTYAFAKAFWVFF